MRKVERFAQRPNKRFIVADRFAGLSESFATGLPLHSTNLMTIFRGFTRGYRRSGESQYQNLIARGKRSGGIAQPLCVNPDCQRKPAFYSVDQFPAFHNVQWLFTPFKRVARVMAQAPVTTGKFHAEISQESIHGDAVG